MLGERKKKLDGQNVDGQQMKTQCWLRWMAEISSCTHTRTNEMRNSLADVGSRALNRGEAEPSICHRWTFLLACYTRKEFRRKCILISLCLTHTRAHHAHHFWGQQQSQNILKIFVKSHKFMSNFSVMLFWTRNLSKCAQKNWHLIYHKHKADMLSSYYTVYIVSQLLSLSNFTVIYHQYFCLLMEINMPDTKLITSSVLVFKWSHFI